MPAGFQARNSSGQLVADITSPTLGLRTKYNITVPSGSGLIRYVDLDVPNTEVPLFALRPATNRTATILSDVPKSGAPSTRVLRIATVTHGDDESAYSPFPAVNTASCAVTVYHFDRMAASGSFGMQLFDESSRCTFDATQKPALARSSSFGTVNLGSGRVGAVAPFYGFRFRRYAIPGVGIREAQYRESVSVSGSSATLYSLAMVVAIDNAGGSESDRYHGKAGGLILDVTGY